MAAAEVLDSLAQDPETAWIADFFGGFNSGEKNEG
jgi:hypothetical protein